MNINYELIGLRINQLRREANLSQEELSVMAGVTAQYISQIERGKKNVSLSVLAEISDGLAVSLDELVFGVAEAKQHVDEWSDVIADCSRFEREIMLETAMALKSVLRRYESIR